MPVEHSLHQSRRQVRRRGGRRRWVAPWVLPFLAMLVTVPILPSSTNVQRSLDQRNVARAAAPGPQAAASEERRTDPLLITQRIGSERLQEPITDRPRTIPQRASLEDRPHTISQHASLGDRPLTDPLAAGAPASIGPAVPGTDPAESHSVAGALDGLECTGYPEPRIFIETQDWWVSTLGDQNGASGHVHVGTCFPYLQQIRGVVRFDLRVVMHENPGHLRRVDVAIYAADGTGVVVPVEFDRDCAGTCVFTAPVHVDTSTVFDGWQEFRFKARVDQPDGTEMLTSSGWKTYLDNGNAVGGFDGGFGVTARGWYTGVGYQNAYIDALPAGPISGVWTFTLKLAPGADGTPTTSHLVAVDPDFHHGSAGLVIKQDAGECRCTVSIDTTQLVNGFHRLFLRSDSALASGITHSGVLAFAFEVRNP